MEIKEFDELVGKEFDFFGVDMNEFKLGDTVFEAIEDEDDGYRSYMDSVVIKDSNGIFFDKPLAKVRIEKDNGYDIKGYKLIDTNDEHVWLSFGTGDADDYYPYFLFEYEPREAK